MYVGGSSSPLRRPLESAIAGKTDPDEIVDAVLKCLSEYRLINYRGDAVPLLTTNGRILSDLKQRSEKRQFVSERPKTTFLNK